MAGAKRTVAIWSQSQPGRRHIIEYSVAADGNSFQRPVTVAGIKLEAPGEVDISSDAEGAVLASYQSQAFAKPGKVRLSQLMTVVLPADATNFGRPRQLAAPIVRGHAGAGSTLFAAGGGPHGIGIQFEVSDEQERSLDGLFSASVGSNGLLSAPREIGAPPPFDSAVPSFRDRPALAVTSAGEDVVAWTEGVYQGWSSQRIVSASTLSTHDAAGQNATPPTALSAPTTRSQNVATATTSNSTIVAWTEGPLENGRLVYTTSQTGPTPSPPRVLAIGVNRGLALASEGAYAVIAWDGPRNLCVAQFSD